MQLEVLLDQNEEDNKGAILQYDCLPILHESRMDVLFLSSN